MYGRCLGRPQAPVAEGAPSAFPTGGTDGTGSRGPGATGGLSAARTEMSFLIIALILVVPMYSRLLYICGRDENLSLSLYGRGEGEGQIAAGPPHDPLP